jgi:precorrin-3B synthase
VDAAGETTQPALAGPAPLEYGHLTQADSRRLVSLDVPLATMTAHQIAAAATAADKAGYGRLIVTPWRGLLVPDLAQDATGLESAGFILDPASSRHGITACTGAPGCANGQAATRPIASALAQIPSGANARKVHIVACERRCGAPAEPHIEITAAPAGFTVSGLPGRSDVTCDGRRLPEVVALARNGS